MKTAQAVLLLAVLATPARAQGDAPISLGLPVRCALGSTCFIQQYFDHDPSPGAKDYRCGVMSYDGHDGTDFRIPTLAQQRRGVEVLAAAPGMVRGARDGMNDIDVRIAGPQSVKGKECGNGVAVTHAGGWETQYCHMAKGSLRVHPGDHVERGAVLGLVGENPAMPRFRICKSVGSPQWRKDRPLRLECSRRPLRCADVVMEHDDCLPLAGNHQCRFRPRSRHHGRC